MVKLCCRLVLFLPSPRFLSLARAKELHCLHLCTRCHVRSWCGNFFWLWCFVLCVHVYLVRVLRVLSKLTAELDAIPGEMEALDREIAVAEHLAAERLLDRLGSDVEVGRGCGVHTCSPWQITRQKSPRILYGGTVSTKCVIFVYSLASQSVQGAS